MCFFWRSGRRAPRKAPQEKKSVNCPYCMQPIKPEEVLFVTNTSSDIADETFAAFAQKYQGAQDSFVHTGQIITQQDSDININLTTGANGFPVALRWKRNGGEERTTSTRICPHCHCYLPDDIESMDVRSIVLLGGPSCGKTMLIAGMLRMMVGDLAEDKPQTLLNPSLGSVRLERDSLPFARQIQVNLKKGSRDPTEVNRPVFPLVLVAQDVTGQKKTLITLHDFAGEGLGNSEYFLNHPIANHKIDGVLFTVDACQLRALKDNAVENACKDPITAGLSGFSEHQKSFLQKSDALAVVLTKFDVYKHFQGIDPSDKSKSVYVPSLMDHANGVNIPVIKSVSQNVIDILDEDSPATRQTIEGIFQRKWSKDPTLGSVEYFATACLQVQNQPGQDHYGNCFDLSTMHRAYEPLLYMLGRWGIFKVR